MRNKTLAYLALSASLLAANSYAAKDDPEACDGTHKHSHHAKHFSPMHKMMKQLDLSEDQRQQFKTIRQGNKAQYRAHHEALRENHRQLHELIASGGYTEDKASRLAEKHGEIKAEMARLRAAETARLYALLTPEQQKKFSTLGFEDHHNKDKAGRKD